MSEYHKVVHLTRLYLRRTETFIYAQLMRINEYIPIVLTRSKTPWTEQIFPFKNIYEFDSASAEQPAAGFLRKWSNINYQYVRRLSRYEKNWFYKTAMEIDPVIMHVHYAVDASLYCWLKKRLKIPLVISCYGYDVSGFPKQYWGLGKKYLQGAFKDADLFLAMSQDMREDLLALGCPAEKIKIHYYGIDLTTFTRIERQVDSGSLRILFVGNLLPKKGIMSLIRAFAQIHSKFSHVELRLVGDGPLRQQIRSLAQALGCNTGISLAGYLPHDKILEELAGADIFCHPSQTDSIGNKEGIPGAIVEAQATGLPVVSTYHAGIPDIVLDGKTGFLVKEGDVDALADRLSRLIEQPQLRSRFGYTGYQHVQQVANADVQIRHLERIYTELIQGATDPRKSDRSSVAYAP